MPPPGRRSPNGPLRGPGREGSPAGPPYRWAPARRGRAPGLPVLPAWLPRGRGPQLRGFAADCPNAILVRVCGQPRIVAGHLWLSPGRDGGGSRGTLARGGRRHAGPRRRPPLLRGAPVPARGSAGHRTVSPFPSSGRSEAGSGRRERGPGAAGPPRDPERDAAGGARGASSSRQRPEQRPKPTLRRDGWRSLRGRRRGRRRGEGRLGPGARGLRKPNSDARTLCIKDKSAERVGLTRLFPWSAVRSRLGRRRSGTAGAEVGSPDPQARGWK